MMYQKALEYIPFNPAIPSLKKCPKETLDKCAKLCKNVYPSFADNGQTHKHRFL